MAIIDPPAPPGAPTAADGANRLRRKFIDIVNNINGGLADVRSIVQQFGRSNLETELGADATPMGTLYTALKNVLESAEVGWSVDNLPS